MQKDFERKRQHGKDRGNMPHPINRCEIKLSLPSMKNKFIYKVRYWNQKKVLIDTLNCS